MAKDQKAINSSEINEYLEVPFEENIELGYREWRSISSLVRGRLSKEFIRKYKDYLDWGKMSSRDLYDEEFIDEMEGYFKWNLLCEHQFFSEPFLRRHMHRLSPHIVSRHQKLSEAFIEDYKDEKKVSASQII